MRWSTDAAGQSDLTLVPPRELQPGQGDRVLRGRPGQGGNGQGRHPALREAHGLPCRQVRFRQPRVVGGKRLIDLGINVLTRAGLPSQSKLIYVEYHGKNMYRVQGTTTTAMIGLAGLLPSIDMSLDMYTCTGLRDPQVSWQGKAASPTRISARSPRRPVALLPPSRESTESRHRHERRGRVRPGCLERRARCQPEAVLGSARRPTGSPAIGADGSGCRWQLPRRLHDRGRGLAHGHDDDQQRAAAPRVRDGIAEQHVDGVVGDVLLKIAGESLDQPQLGWAGRFTLKGSDDPEGKCPGGGKDDYSYDLEP